MSTVLYRKYRPQAFREVTNQNHVKITLEQEIIQNKFGHAYVFSGPRGVGKTSLARILAKALNCTGRKPEQGEPCNQCNACKEITEGRALDVMEIDAASHTGVDTVREVIIETARFAPSRLKFKIFIIDEAHMLSTAAWNALLKILEEPPQHVIFIFATTENHKIPATILSRCQRFEFKRITATDLVERLKYLSTLENKNVATGVLRSIAMLSEGCVRDAESLLEQVFAVGEKEITEEHASLVLPYSSLPVVLDFLTFILKNDPRGAIDLVNHIMFDGYDLTQFATQVVETLRKMLLTKIQSTTQSVMSLDLDEVSAKKFTEVSALATVSRLMFLAQLFLDKRQDLKNSPLPQLPLEMAVLEACGEGVPQAPSMIASSARVHPPSASSAGVYPPPTKVDVSDTPKKTPLTKTVVSDKLKISDDIEKVVAPKQEPLVNINLKDVIAKWPAILIDVQEENHSLPLILNVSQPVKIVGNTLQIGVGYNLHKDKLNEAKTQIVLSKLIEKHCGVKLGVEGVLLERKDDAGDVLEEALKTFGGTVVE